MSRPLSKRMREVLEIIGCTNAGSWGEVWTHYRTKNGDTARDERIRRLQFLNFDRVCNAAVARGLVEEDQNGDVMLSVRGCKAVGLYVDPEPGDSDGVEVRP